VPDRADAAQALADIKGSDAVIAALSDAASHDRFWGVRVQALDALGRIGGAQAEKGVVPELQEPQPWVREVAVEQFSKFSDEPTVGAKLTEIAAHDAAYRVRAAALLGLGQRKPAGAMNTLEAASKTDSPDDVIRRAALRALGALGNDQAVPRLLDWSEQGKPVRLRAAAIASLGQVAKKDESVESRLIAQLDDPDFDVRFAAIFALGDRGDPAGIEPLETLQKSGDIPSGEGPVIERQIARIKNPGAAQQRDGTAASETASAASGTSTGTASSASSSPNAANGAPPNGRAAGFQVNQQIVERLDKIEQNLAEMNERLKKIELQQSHATP